MQLIPSTASHYNNQKCNTNAIRIYTCNYIPSPTMAWLTQSTPLPEPLCADGWCSRRKVQSMQALQGCYAAKVYNMHIRMHPINPNQHCYPAARYASICCTQSTAHMQPIFYPYNPTLIYINLMHWGNTHSAPGIDKPTFPAHLPPLRAWALIPCRVAKSSDSDTT